MHLSDNKVELVKRHNKVVYRDEDRIVKVFIPTKPAQDVFREALNLARIATTDLKTPEVLEVSQMDDGTGAWALSYKYFPGITFYSLMDEAKGTPQFDELLEEFAALQIAVQRTPVPPALNHQSNKLKRMIGRVKSLDPSQRYDLQMRAERMSRGHAICHGDFNPTNVIVGEDKQYFFCDWTHVTEGLPEADAAMTYILLHEQFPEAADKYLDLYSVMADIPKQKIQYWLPVVAAAELSRGRAGNEFLNEWIDVANDFE